MRRNDGEPDLDEMIIEREAYWREVQNERWSAKVLEEIRYELRKPEVIPQSRLAIKVMHNYWARGSR